MNHQLAICYKKYKIFSKYERSTRLTDVASQRAVRYARKRFCFCP